ncbi:TIGR04454 family lipoprotein [Leptospira wolffii]|uniref:TIGR04454 family lipoprotein n=1 Tax=Leptospira wolffii TaxID=409998 RepID=A0A2M9ZBZ5_9LEPT|nr:TIGR04454 family lipoprotein [Leptospira wolffii]EPG65819.1 putative lipoprotein [Leptospira wolffii serovar Khorat str. Khorat-H2]PJZ65928.1 TIGR04454 family lipoprotein [Leptospira wolffii]TGK59353.1 TIGR04454 family lipoprotein [Leptospira wolffii]TGK71264.1 TIGR04454 family lipoprotein [Leptospira wolffii]TGK77831.1 TIGR04454 family lipoprotein [Leptospira wolffii]
MKKTYSLILAILLLSLAISCGGAKVSQAECEPVVGDLIKNLTATQTPDQLEKFQAVQAQMTTQLLKECMTGKYDLTCLRSAKTITALGTCKK